MGYIYLLGFICFVGIFLILKYLDNESRKAKSKATHRDNKNDGCINKLFIIFALGGLLAYTIITIQMCSNSERNNYDYYEPRHSD